MTQNTPKGRIVNLFLYCPTVDFDMKTVSFETVYGDNAGTMTTSIAEVKRAQLNEVQRRRSEVLAGKTKTVSVSQVKREVQDLIIKN